MGSQKLIMKLLITLSTILAISSGNPCEDCTAVVSTLAMFFTSDDSLSIRVGTLLGEVCPEADDPDACVAGLPDFWAKIAMVLWPGYYNPSEPFMCATEDICGAPGAKLAMTCDECVNGIMASFEQLVSEEFLTGIVEWLSGEEFCGMDEDPATCADIIAQLIPVALPALVGGFDPTHADILCNMAVPDTCPA